MMMKGKTLDLVLADDDTDDCLFFRDVLDELEVTVALTMVGDGEELMQLLLSKEVPTPDAIYLDLNMPRKNGYECLLEIKKHIALKKLPIIIYSTSLNEDVVDRVYNSGASYYIQKPAEFKALKAVILKSILLIPKIRAGQTAKENFVLNRK